MTTNTPGPWSYRPIPNDSTDPNRLYWVDDSTGTGAPIADIFNTGDTAEYNARLIAAAPDLLEALIILSDHAREQYPHFESPRGQEDIERALAAIERAKPID